MKFSLKLKKRLTKDYRRLKERIISILKNDSIIYVFICGLLSILYFIEPIHSFVKDFPFDAKTLISVVIVFFLTSLASLFANIISAKFEDTTKLTTDYAALTKKYEANANMLVHYNLDSENRKIGRKRTKCSVKTINHADEVIIPVCDVIMLLGKEIKFQDNPDKKYVAPEFSLKNYHQLIKAHGSSSLYNQLNIRVDDIDDSSEKVLMTFSRTTYFDSLVTNRAIDFKIDGLSVRDLYSSGPFIESLKDSKLSNHLGFNGMVETSDHYFVFIKRNRHVSIGKETMQCSVAASLKSKRALNKDGKLEKSKIEQAILKEIEEELCLQHIKDYELKKNEIFKDFSFEKNVAYFYRDLLEGGKPQFMFYAQIQLTADEVKKAFHEEALFPFTHLETASAVHGAEGAGSLSTGYRRSL